MVHIENCLKNKTTLYIILTMAAVIFHTTSVRAQGQGEISFSSSREQTQLLEVFVSQGCSSCPPAQNWINTWVNNPRLWTQVVPIVFHVDYWDDIGWPDPFASPAYSRRQRQYQAAGDVSSVYTPGFVVNGREWRGWFKRQALPGKRADTGQLTAKVESGRLHAAYGLPSKGQVLNVAVLGFGLSTDVTRGENRNRRLLEDFTVLSLDSIPSDNGQWDIPLPGLPGKATRYALALWVTNGNDPTPLQAAGGWLPEARE